MSAKGIKRKVKAAAAKVEVEMNNHGGSMYERGLAIEGFAGGYYKALCDVLLLLNGVIPETRKYWSTK